MARPRGSMALQVEGASLADALETFPRRKTNRTVRALLQNCAALSPWGFSFRRWLEHACASLGAGSFPPSDFLAEASDGVVAASLERVLRRRIEHSFYQVGPALAEYMLSDWQLGLWYADQTGVFDTFKLDAFHEHFVQRYGHDRIPTNEMGFAHWWRKQYPNNILSFPQDRERVHLAHNGAGDSRYARLERYRNRSAERLALDKRDRKHGS